MATVLGRLEAQSSGKLPSTTEQNPRPHASAITLRSGKKAIEPEVVVKKAPKRGLVAKSLPNEKVEETLANEEVVVEDETKEEDVRRLLKRKRW